jgi:peptide/nickel transport system permease protein
VIEFLCAFLYVLPTIPRRLGLAAALPRDWSSLKIYFAITVMLSMIGCTELGRVVRGPFLSMKTEDFVSAAELDGASRERIILRQMAQRFASHIIAAATLAAPSMILAETALDYLGPGLQPPTVSWGVLLQEAQSIRALPSAPRLFWPEWGWRWSPSLP